MTLPLYPASPLPQLPIAYRPVRRVKKGGPFGGERWRTSRNHRYSLLQWSLSYFTEAWSDLATLLNFWEDVAGANGVFDYVDPNNWDTGGVLWTRVYAGQIASSTLDYNLPIATSSSADFELTLNGAVQTIQRLTSPGAEDGTSDVYVYPGIGVNGRDKATTRVQQTIGDILLVTGTGSRILTARFVDEEFPFSWSELDNRTAGALNLEEVR